jgi:hypothetical protein
MSTGGKAGGARKSRSAAKSRENTEADANEQFRDHDHDAGSDSGEKVGYGRPPRHSRFRPGQSGNPKGRPKGARSIQDGVSEVFRKARRVKVQGKTVRMPTFMVILASQAERAMRGDVAAFRALTPLMMRLVDGDEGGEAVKKLPEEDRRLLADFVERLTREQQTRGKDGGS